MDFNYFSNNALDVHKIANLFHASFKRELNPEYWNWRFLHNPFSKKVYISYATDDSTLVAYYAVSPFDVLVEGKKYKVALSNMTMTHPDYQGFGLFSQLARMLYDQLRDDGYIAVCGFANSNSHYGFRKRLGWNDLSILNIFRREGMQHEHISIPYEICDSKVTKNILYTAATLNSYKSEVSFSRNYDFLKWRLLMNPEHSYRAVCAKENGKIMAVLIYKEFNFEIDVMEYFYDMDFDNELVTILNSSLSLSGKPVNIWCNLFSDEHLLLEKNKFIESTFITYFGYIPLVNVPKEFSLYRNWHYRFIDSDVF